MMTLAVYPVIVCNYTPLFDASDAFFKTIINSKFRLRQKLKHDD